MEGNKDGNRETAVLKIRGKQGNRETAILTIGGKQGNRETRVFLKISNTDAVGDLIFLSSVFFGRKLILEIISV